MIPKIIHFVWLGPMPQWCHQNISRFADLNPSHEIRLHRSSKELLPQYAPKYQACETVSMQADLLRMSVLEKYGGWYFDTDIFALRSVSKIESAYDIGHRIFTPAYQGTSEISNSILAADLKCRAWLVIHQMVQDAPKSPDHLEFANNLWTDLRSNRPEFLCLSHYNDFAVEGYLASEVYNRLMRGEKIDTLAYMIHGFMGNGTATAVID